MTLYYRIEKKEKSFFISVREKGSSKVLYAEDAKRFATKEDEEILKALLKIQKSHFRSIETTTLEKVSVPLEKAPFLVRKIQGTKRFSQLGNPLEKAPKKIAPKPLLQLKTQVGTEAELWFVYEEERVLFSDFAPSIGPFRRDQSEEKRFEKDLLDVGFSPKDFSEGLYICERKKSKEALSLLIAIGWEVFSLEKKPLSTEVSIEEQRGKIAMKLERFLLDPELEKEGAWEGDIFYVKKADAPLLKSFFPESQALWEEKLFTLANLLESGAFPEAIPTQRFQGSLYPYQQEGVNWLMGLYSHGFSALLADEMGLGKTVQVLAFLSHLGKSLPVLIVTPSSLRFHWEKEIERFLPDCEAIEIVSYAFLRKSIDLYRLRHFEAIILDESHMIKTFSTQIAKAVCSLSSRFRIGISGTPIENRLDELWSQYRFLLPGFLERKSDIATVKKKIRPFFLRRKKDESGVQLPEKIEQSIFLEMEEEQKALYQDLKNQPLRQKDSMMEILEKILRLRQMAIDPRLLGHKAQGIKYQKICEDIQEVVKDGRNVLVYSSFSSVLRLFKEAFPEALYLDGSTSEKRRKHLVERFQGGEKGLCFFLSLKAGGVGLNLSAADYVFIIDPWWNEAAEDQALNRSHRIGRKETVIARRYICSGSIEEKILRIKERKQELFDKLLGEKSLPFSTQELISLF